MGFVDGCRTATGRKWRPSVVRVSGLWRGAALLPRRVRGDCSVRVHYRTSGQVMSDALDLDSANRREDVR